MSNRQIEVTELISDPNFWDGPPKSDEEQWREAIAADPEAKARLKEFSERGEQYDSKARDFGAFGLVTDEYLRNMEVEETEMIIEKILPAGGLTVAAAKPKAGKSTLVMAICHAVATGQDLFGEYATKQGPVIYWCPDDNNLKRARKNWIALSGGVEVPNFQMTTRKYELNTEGIPYLESVAALLGPAVIVVDSYTSVRGRHAKGGDIVADERDDMSLLKQLGQRTGAAVLLIHHSPKTKYDDPMEASAGTYATGAASDTRWVWEKLENNARLVLTDGRDTEESAFVYAMGSDKKLYLLIDGPPARHWKTVQEVTSNLENGWTGVLSYKDIAGALAVQPRQGKRILATWKGADVVTGRRGEYRFAREVLKALDETARIRNLTNMEEPRGLRLVNDTE